MPIAHFKCSAFDLLRSPNLYRSRTLEIVAPSCGVAFACHGVMSIDAPMSSVTFSAQLSKFELLHFPTSSLVTAPQRVFSIFPPDPAVCKFSARASLGLTDQDITAPGCDSLRNCLLCASNSIDLEGASSSPCVRSPRRYHPLTCTQVGRCRRRLRRMVYPSTTFVRFSSLDEDTSSTCTKCDRPTYINSSAFSVTSPLLSRRHNSPLQVPVHTFPQNSPRSTWPDPWSRS